MGLIWLITVVICSPIGKYLGGLKYFAIINNSVLHILIYIVLYNQEKQDWELTVAQIMSSLLPNSDLKLTKVGKTTRPFRHDLNQIPYDYTEEMKNRFKGLDLIECLKNYR